MVQSDRAKRRAGVLITLNSGAGDKEIACGRRHLVRALTLFIKELEQAGSRFKGAWFLTVTRDELKEKIIGGDKFYLIEIEPGVQAERAHITRCAEAAAR